MRRLMHILMPDCRKATFLIEKGNDIPLPVKDKWQLHLHLSMCRGCRNYAKQNRFLERMLKRFAQVTLWKGTETTALEQKVIQEIEKVSSTS